MIRRLLSIGLLASLGACSAMSPGHRGAAQPDAASQAGSTASSDTVCDSTPVLSLVGKVLTPQLTERARAQSHSGTVRVVRPGEVMTMEYDPARLNFIVDGQSKVITLHCG